MNIENDRNQAALSVGHTLSALVAMGLKRDLTHKPVANALVRFRPRTGDPSRTRFRRWVGRGRAFGRALSPGPCPASATGFPDEWWTTPRAHRSKVISIAAAGSKSRRAHSVGQSHYASSPRLVSHSRLGPRPVFAILCFPSRHRPADFFIGCRPPEAISIRRFPSFSYLSVVPYRLMRSAEFSGRHSHG